MKFGGTSVADAIGRAAIAQRVSAALESGKSPVVVVSAMGRAGAPYATDTLLELVDGLPGELAESDWLMATGEIISAIVCAHELRSIGVDARAFTGADAGIITDGKHGSSAIVEIRTERLVDAIAHGQVPVVAGFQGVSVDGRITTLGRGGSDTTACALGVALEAESVEIYTDVDGVATADPRVCSGAETLEVITADELFQMARHGSRVVHTPAAQLALASGLAVRVRNTFSDHPGTLVANIASYRPDKVATAISHSTGVVRISVSLPAPEGTPAHMSSQAQVYRAMADAGVSLDMFTPVVGTLVFSVGQGSLDSACAVLGGLGLPYEVREGLAKVTLVGAGMHGVPGVMATMAEALDGAGVTVLQTSDSHTTISVLICAEDTDAAIEALHSRFELGS
ncbi:MAG: aspartate kinase [Actinobacteria bacterium]|nr:aspartate kinase [Actinomycetota bacterium]